MTGIIVKSKIRQVVKEIDETKSVQSVSEEFEKALEKHTRDSIKKAIERAKANQRKTLLARDL